jgi:thiol-disulfide isomerase/thioredoxin
MSLTILAMAVLVIGSLVSVAGGIMLIVAAFSVSVLWGLAVLFLPLAGLVFLIMHWAEARKAFLINLGGVLICLISIPVLMLGARPVAPSPDATGEAAPDPGVIGRIQATLGQARSALRQRATAFRPARPPGPDGYIGMSLDEVRTELGRPKGEMRFAGKSALMYEDFMLISENGRDVKSVVLKKDFDTISMTEPEVGQADGGQPEKVKVISNGGAAVELAAILVPGKITVVDFYADWCGPCRQLAPQVESLVAANQSAYLRKVDIVNWGTPVTGQYGISSVPNVRVFGSDGQMVGAPTHDINRIREYLGQAR